MRIRVRCNTCGLVLGIWPGNRREQAKKVLKKHKKNFHTSNSSLPKYDVIYADPPWFYNPRNNRAAKFGGGAGNHYPLMKTSEICTLDVPSITSPNAVLFLWATFPKLLEAFKVIEA